MKSFPEELGVLLDVTDRVRRVGIDYMVTGSMALPFYTRPRMTRDIDIVIRFRSQDVQPLVEALKDAYIVDDRSVRRTLRQGPPLFNVIHEETVVKVDFILHQDEPYRHTAFERRRPRTLGDTAVVVIAAEDLILSKLVWARETESGMQLTDVTNLVRSVDDLDTGYVARWAGELGVDDLWKECRK